MPKDTENAFPKQEVGTGPRRNWAAPQLSLHKPTWSQYMAELSIFERNAEIEEPFSSTITPRKREPASSRYKGHPQTETKGKNSRGRAKTPQKVRTQTQPASPRTALPHRNNPAWPLALWHWRARPLLVPHLLRTARGRVQTSGQGSPSGTYCDGPCAALPHDAPVSPHRKMEASLARSWVLI